MSPVGLHAPRKQGAILIVPPIGEAERLVHANTALFATADCPICDLPLQAFRLQVQAEAFEVARRFAQQHGLQIPMRSTGPLVITGHQPELFHPGVWLKNFVADQVARHLGGCSGNLVVDNDVATQPSIAVPVCLENRPVALPIAYDQPRPAVPWEEWEIEDRQRFAGFAAAVSRVTAAWPFQPLLSQFWQLTGSSSNLAECFAVARHRLEERWGCINWEWPLSRLCDGWGFRRFFHHVVTDLPRFWHCYNEALAEYRSRRRIRSQRHPIPDLDRQGDWFEAPFWIWSRTQPQRERLYIRHRPGVFELAVHLQTVGELPDTSPESEKVTAFWQALSEAGWKIRSRALTTTLFVRLVLADLFIHGIGGSIYDEITDGIFERFLGIRPPAYLTVSGTLRLPFAPCLANEPSPDVADLRLQLRRLWYQPERWLDRDSRPEVRRLIAAKQALIAEPPRETESKRRRWRSLQQVTEAMRGFLSETRQRLETELAEDLKRVEKYRVLCSREYAFCLHPEDSLRPWLTAGGEGSRAKPG